MTDKHVDAELTAYLDGEISVENSARIRKHLESCEYCRAALRELQILQQEMRLTLDHALQPVHLSHGADDRIRKVLLSRLEHRPSWWQALWQVRGLVGQMVMAVFVLMVSAFSLSVLVPSAPGPVHETIVLGQDTYSPGSQGALRVVVQSLGSALPSAVPVAGADVMVSLVSAPGIIENLYSGQTDATGSAAVTFMMPENVIGPTELIVETTSSAGTERIVRSIQVQRSYKIFLGSDKPTYRPGQVVYLRALVMDADRNLPVADELLTFEISNEDQQVAYREQVFLSAYGVGFAEFKLPENSALGSYTIRAVIDDTTVERIVDVNLYPPPAFSVNLETEERFLLQGDSLHGLISCSYFFGKPVQGSAKILLMTDDNAILSETNGPLDEQGILLFTFNIPTGVNKNKLTILASVQDAAGQIEGLQRDVPLSDKPLVIKTIPESGELKVGVENIIYIAVAYPDGRSAPTDLSLSIGEETAEFSTDSFGLAAYRFIPQGATQLRIKATDKDGLAVTETMTLQSGDETTSLLLRTDRAIYHVGDTLTAHALTSASDMTQLFLDIVRNGQTVSVFSAPVVNHEAVFALDLDHSLAGTLNLRVYILENGQVAVDDSRLVVVDPAGTLDVSATSDKEVYRPGEHAKISLDTAVGDQDGALKGMQSVLGVAIVDTSVLNLEMLPPGFARTYFLIDTAALDASSGVPGFDPLSLVEGEENLRRVQDKAAKAAWANVHDVSYASPSSARVESVDEKVARRQQLARGLPWLLILLPLGLTVVVINGLIPSGVFWSATRRLGWVLLAGFLLVPFILVDLVLGALVPWLGALAAAGFLILVVVLLIGLVILSGVRRDNRLQLVVGLVTVYILITGLVLFLASTTPAVPQGWVTIIAALFILLLISLFLFGQGLLFEKRHLEGWLITILVLILILLAVSLPAIPQLQSDLSHTLSNPVLYSGPIGWLSSCASAYHATEEPLMTGEPEVEAEATPLPAPTPSPQATAVPEPALTATAVTVPLETYPFRQLFPETLYWAPHVETDNLGHAELNIEIADSITTWHLAALGSTKNGEIGAAGMDLLAFQDFFVDVDVVDTLHVGQPSSISLTVYNYMDEPQRIRWEITPADDFDIIQVPERLNVDSNSIANSFMQIIPGKTGTIVLEIRAIGDQMVDSIQVEIEVTP